MVTCGADHSPDKLSPLNNPQILNRVECRTEREVGRSVASEVLRITKAWCWIRELDEAPLHRTTAPGDPAGSVRILADFVRAGY